MKTNSQILLSPRMYMGDIDGDGTDELIEVDGRHLYIFKCNNEHTPLLEHVFPSRVKRLIIGDFVVTGRERGKDQILAILEDGSIQGWAISDDKTVMWWWFTQANFIKDADHFIVGDFDGDTADEIMVYTPATGGIKIFERKNTGILGEMTFSPGNLSAHDLKNKLLLAGEFGQTAGRKDLLVLDRATGVVKRFDSVTDSAGAKTFWWAFTTNAGQFKSTDDVIVANTENGLKDSLIVRDNATGQYKILLLEFVSGNLKPSALASGQLPVKPKMGRIQAAKVREPHLRTENGARRDDIVYFHDPLMEIIRTDARYDAALNKFTYWFAYSSNIVVEPVKVAEKKPWAVILCKFKGMAGDPAIEKFFREIFTPGSGGLIEYWHDVSNRSVDISDSKVFGYVELDLERKDCALSRDKLIDAAIRAAKNAGIETVAGFHKQIAVFTHNFSVDGAPAGADWSDPVWGKFWLDGSADNSGRVSAPPHMHTGTIIAHEMGHGFNMAHDRASDLTTHYGDPYCIMSSTGFIHPKWNVPFGPSLCVTHLVNKNWTWPRRIVTFPSTWVTTGVTFKLAPWSDPKIEPNLGIILPASNSKFNYFIEYQVPAGWNRALANPLVVIRRNLDSTSAYLGSITVPAAKGGKASFTEASGKVKFEVEKIRDDNRVVQIKATRIP